MGFRGSRVRIPPSRLRNAMPDSHTSDGPLSDGRQVNVPEFGRASVDGRRIIGDHSVDSDPVAGDRPAVADRLRRPAA